MWRIFKMSNPSYSVLHSPLAFIDCLTFVLRSLALLPGQGVTTGQVSFSLPQGKWAAANTVCQPAESSRKQLIVYPGGVSTRPHAGFLDLLIILKCFECNKTPNVLFSFIFSRTYFRRNIIHMLLFSPLLNHFFCFVRTVWCPGSLLSFLLVVLMYK